MTSPTKMPADIKAIWENLSNFEKSYAEFRVKGMSQANAAKSAGSKAKTNANLSRVGYNTEQREDVKRYMNYLMESRAKAAMVDDVDIIDKLNRTWEAAYAAGKYSDANKAAELLGQMAGLFQKNSPSAVKNQPAESPSKEKSVAVFREDSMDESDDLSDAIRRLAVVSRKKL